MEEAPRTERTVYSNDRSEGCDELHTRRISLKQWPGSALSLVGVAGLIDNRVDETLVAELL